MKIQGFLACCLVGLLQAGEPISIALDKEVLSLNPLLLAREVESQAVDLVFDRLITVDAQGNYLPQMLEGWVISKDGRDILLRLRPGLTWQDGSPIEAEDLVATWRLLSLPDVKKIYDLVGIRTLDSLQAEGPLAVRIRLRRPRASLLADLYNFQPVPRRLYSAAASKRSHPLNFAPVGSGPYRVLPGANAREIRLKRWDGYKGPHPGRWEEFRFQVKSLDDPEYLDLLKGGTFHFGNLDWFHHYLLRKGAFGTSHLTAQSAPTAAFETFWLNCQPGSSLLADPRLRVALAELVPWEFLSAQRHLRPARAANSLWPPQSLAYDPTPQPLPRLERAQALLDEAGWHTGPDGIRRDATGRPLSLNMVSERGFSARDVSQAFCDQARRAGVVINLQRASFNDVQERSAKGEGDIWFFGWNTSLDPNDDAPLFTTEGIASGVNVMRYRNKEVDELFQRAQHELDPVARRGLYMSINTIIQRESPIIQTTYGVAYLAVDRRLQGIGFNPLGQTYGYVPGRRAWSLGN